MNETKNTLEQKATSGSAAKTLIRQYMMLIVLLAMIVFFGACNRQFLTWDNLITVTRQVSIIGICATGMMFALLVGHIDLSIGTTVSFSAVLFATLVTDKPEYSLLGFPVNPYLAMLIVLIVCAGLGAIKGSLVVGTNMPALIATLAVSTALEGVNLLITNAMPISGIPESIHWLGRGFLFNAIPMPIVIFLAIVLVAGFILRFTYIGRYIYATGSNTEAARLAGLNVKLIKTAAYMVATQDGGLPPGAGYLHGARDGPGICQDRSGRAGMSAKRHPLQGHDGADPVPRPLLSRSEDADHQAVLRPGEPRAAGRPDHGREGGCAAHRHLELYIVYTTEYPSFP